MKVKKIIPFINVVNDLDEKVMEQALFYARHGADELFVYNYSKIEVEREAFLKLVKQIVAIIDIPVIIGCYVNRFEDVKKALYTGAKQVVIKKAVLDNDNSVREAVNRFGNDKLLLELEDFHDALLEDVQNWAKEIGFYAFLIKHLTLTDALCEQISSIPFPVYLRDSLIRNDLIDLMRMKNVEAVSTNHFEQKNLRKVKEILKENQIPVNTFDSSLSFADFKCNRDGLLPVIAQDYKTNEVLMLAYMNEEAYRLTLDTGVMTYFSRSRNELWVKGKTSGHYQYVKSLTIDCDNDTILAKVEQVGAACHTGHTSCFYTDLVKKEYDDINPLMVFQDIYDIILDRKNNPKEGSYTNYLFDKGIDKILKKCGEEATEIVIAAKNPDAEELKYEISDFLYHMMVLMVQCDVNWKDIVTELAHRR